MTVVSITPLCKPLTWKLCGQSFQWAHSIALHVFCIHSWCKRMQLMFHFLNSLYNATTTVHSYFFPVSKGWKNEVRLKHFKGGSIPSLLLSGCLTHNLDQYAKNLHNVKKTDCGGVQMVGWPAGNIRWQAWRWSWPEYTLTINTAPHSPKPTYKHETTLTVYKYFTLLWFTSLPASSQHILVGIFD